MANGEWPSQVSSQKRVVAPSPMTTLVLLNNNCLTFMSPFQKGESVGLTVTWDSVLVWRYLLRRICAHMASVPEASFHNHLLRRHLFLTSRFSIPSPPWSLGRQIISHLATLTMHVVEKILGNIFYNRIYVILLILSTSKEIQ